MPSAHASLIAAALGDELTEREASVRVFLTAGGLAILGCALLLFTIWWWRGTKPEPPALGPLEIMSDRRWHAASDNERRRLVEVNRPDAALRLEGVQAPVPIDLSELARDQPSGFDDLRDSPDRWPFGQAESEPSADGSVLGLGAAAEVDEPSEPIVVAVDDAVDTAVDDDTAVDPGDPLVAPSGDETMYQVDAPLLDGGDEVEGDIESPNGVVHLDHELDHFDQHDDGPEDGEHDDHADHDEPSDELVIDPLLQRTASQD